MKLPLSVIILTYNEERNVRDCLDSVCGLADEIFVVDSGSTDRTLKITKRYTDKVYVHSFENFARQRNWAQDNLPLVNKWVFHLDADERVSGELADWLKSRFDFSGETAGIMVPRRTVFRGRWIKHGGHYPVYHLRIFKKDKGRSEERLYDQNYMVRGKTIKGKGDILNVINPDLPSWKDRHRKWAHMEAMEVLCNENRSINIKLDGTPIERRNWMRYEMYYRFPLFVRPIIYFLYRFILRLGFLDGKEGIAFHFWQGLWYRYLVDLEIYRMRRKRSSLR